MRSLPRSLSARPIYLVVAVSAVLLAGCSAGVASPTASSGTPSAGAQRPARGFGGVSGPIASVGTGSFTVTSGSTPATVDYTASTVFDRTAPATRTAVTAGSCVLVVETSGSDATTGSVDASSVRISPAVNGSCSAAAGRGAGGFGGGGSGGGSGAPGSAGPGAPASGSQGARRFPGFGNGGGAVAGTVASTSGSGFTVSVTAGAATGGSSSVTTTVVNVSAATTYTVTTTSSAKDLAVGECARVSSGGRPGTTSGSAATATPGGPVTADSVTLSAPVNGSCTTAGQGNGPGGTGGASGSTGGA
jgi:hypothetical protein